MILHIDMDAFFASVEQMDNPALRGKCVIVGGKSGRGVVAASSYEARKFGVCSAMPVFQARRKCPNGIFVVPRKKRYKEVSMEIMSLLNKYSPLVEQVSIDEAYLDAEGCARLVGEPEKMAMDIKKDIAETVGLTCSIGVAPIKFLAKIASDMDKPDGMTVISRENAMLFIETLPIRKVPGVGEAMNKSLEILGIGTLGDVRKIPDKILTDRLGKFGVRLKAMSNGEESSCVSPFRAAKSVSSEETLAGDTGDPEVLAKYLLKHSEDVGRELRKSGLRAKTIHLKLKYSDFKQVTRSVSLAIPVQSSDTIYKEALKMLENRVSLKKARLIGVGASNLFRENMFLQMNLFEDPETDVKWEKIEKTVDSISCKYGKDIVKRASLNDIKR